MSDRDCPHGRQIGKCTDCDVERLEAENEALREANEAFSKRQEWWNDKMVALEERNAELVEALRWCIRQMPEPVLPGGYTDGYKKARAALARAGVSNG